MELFWQSHSEAKDNIMRPIWGDDLKEGRLTQRLPEFCLWSLVTWLYFFLSEMCLTETKDERVQNWAEWNNRTCVSLPVALVLGNSLQQQFTGTFCVIMLGGWGRGPGWPLSCSLLFDSPCLRKVKWPTTVGWWNLWNLQHKHYSPNNFTLSLLNHWIDFYLQSMNWSRSSSRSLEEVHH